MPLSKDIVASAEQTKELFPIEDVTMIGYPNGIWDSTNNLPIIRQGITATPASVNYEGKSEFMIDCACFPGSSGSPVFILNEGSFKIRDGISMGSRLILLGILYAGPQHNVEGDIQIVNIPTDSKAVAFSRIPNNLGLCIKAVKVLDFEQQIEEWQKLQAPTPTAACMPTV